MNKLIDNCIQYAIDRNIVYCDSVDSYYSGKKPSFWRKVIFYLRFLVLTIHLVKYGLFMLYPKTIHLKALQDNSTLFGKQAIIVHALFFSVYLVTLLGKLIVVYYEMCKNLKIIDMTVDWKARKPSYQLSQKHRKKITLRTFILYYGLLRITGTIISIFLTFFFIIYTLVVYLYDEYNSIIMLIFWTIITIIAINEIRIIVLFATLFFYFPITLLNYRFDELIVRLRVSIRWNNPIAINQVLECYNELIKDCSQLSGPYNLVIGLVYCLAPYILATFVELMKIKRNDFIFQFFKMTYLFLFILTNSITFTINQLSASITVRNKSIHKYLYPMFYSERIIRIRTKLAIDSFIARLNTQFIGFYCFNLFKFTKMAFYQYAFSVSTCYFLITNILKT